MTVLLEGSSVCVGRGDGVGVVVTVPVSLDVCDIAADNGVGLAVVWSIDSVVSWRDAVLDGLTAACSVVELIGAVLDRLTGSVVELRDAVVVGLTASVVELRDAVVVGLTASVVELRDAVVVGLTASVVELRDAVVVDLLDICADNRGRGIEHKKRLHYNPIYHD